MFSNASYFDDIDWNPSTGTTPNWRLPDSGNLSNNDRRRRRDAADEFQGARGPWRVEDNVRGRTWGAPAGTDDPQNDPRLFSHQQHRHTSSSRLLSTGHTDHRHISPISNMNGHMNGHANDRTDSVLGAVNDQYRQHRRPDYNDDAEGSEDEPFFLKNQFSTARSNSNLLHPSAPTPSQYPPYPVPFPWPMYSHYPAPHDIYAQQQIPYGYPPTIPPHSNSTNNAAFLNTGKDDPKKEKKIHRRKSQDDEALATDWSGSGNGNDFNNNNEWGWPTNNNNGGNNNNDDDDDNNEEPFRRHTHVNTRSHRSRTSLNDGGRLDGPSQRSDAHDGHRRHISSPEWGAPLDINDNDLDPGAVRIRIGDVNPGGWYSSSHEQSTRSNILWGEPTDNNAYSPGLGTLSRELTDLRLDQQRGSSRRRHASFPPDLVEPDAVDPTHQQSVIWGDPTNNDNSQVQYTQPHANERPVYTNGSAFVDRVPNSPRRLGHQSTYPMTSNEYSSGSSREPQIAYESRRRRAYADALDVGTYNRIGGGGTGFSTGNANGVASQFKEKAMKWLKGAGIGSMTLHPVLRTPTILKPSLLTWDVRRKPNPARAGIPIGEAMTSFTGTMPFYKVSTKTHRPFFYHPFLVEPASKPPLQHMLVIVPIPDLPGTFWHVDVYPRTEDLHGKSQFTFGGSPTSFGRPEFQRKKSSSSASYDYDQHPYYSYNDYAAILCADVLSALTRMLHKSATSHDYHALPKPRQKQVYDAFILRCREMEDPFSGHVFIAHTDKTKNDPEVDERVERKYQRGLKRVDFLCGRTRWEGLEPNGVESWTVKLGKST